MALMPNLCCDNIGSSVPLTSNGDNNMNRSQKVRPVNQRYANKPLLEIEATITHRMASIGFPNTLQIKQENTSLLQDNPKILTHFSGACSASQSQTLTRHKHQS